MGEVVGDAVVGDSVGLAVVGAEDGASEQKKVCWADKDERRQSIVNIFLLAT